MRPKTALDARAVGGGSALEATGMGHGGSALEATGTGHGGSALEATGTGRGSAIDMDRPGIRREAELEAER
jgi:hypothetical protein